MSAQESTIATLQHQLHKETQRRFEQIESNQDRQGKILEQLLVNTADLSSLKIDVDTLKVDRDNAKGAIKIVGALGIGGMVGAIKFLFFKH